MPKKITAWQCEYCNRYRKTKRSITRHEKICFHNPDRKVLEGQMAIFATIPRELTYEDSYGVPGSDFTEPIWEPDEELSAKYKWWPRDENGYIGLGYIFKGGRWKKIEGYVPPHFAPGFSWVDEVIPDEYLFVKKDSPGQPV